ncbi:MAG: hypothetical protein H7255_17930 [Ramlibacter sp.]|nr:hypothetical protein [Ramlibacter sp.]
MIQIPKGSPSYNAALNATARPHEASAAPVAKRACAPVQLTPIPAPPLLLSDVAKSDTSFADQVAKNYAKASGLGVNADEKTFARKALDAFAESARAAAA